MHTVKVDLSPVKDVVRVDRRPGAFPVDVLECGHRILAIVWDSKVVERPWRHCPTCAMAKLGLAEVGQS